MTIIWPKKKQGLEKLIYSKTFFANYFYMDESFASCLWSLSLRHILMQCNYNEPWVIDKHLGRHGNESKPVVCYLQEEVESGGMVPLTDPDCQWAGRGSEVLLTVGRGKLLRILEPS